ncbi:MAG: GMC family oxidoreductase [Bacteriovoracaceae bacterium]|nr:GMC family oxidoreductase [Bacteriovoracaceae bacterium]
MKYDVIIVGAGVSGSFIAQDLAVKGVRVLVIEAGRSFTRDTYPRKEIDANAQLYWGGGVELNSSATLALLRPKVVGGGSIVNQALMDRFDHIALDSWRSQSGAGLFSEAAMAPWYEAAENELIIQDIPESTRNGNAEIFAEGFKACGFTCKPLSRAQSGCKFEEGNDCIECLSGCRIDSKQSTPVTVLRRALRAGCHLASECEVQQVKHTDENVVVSGVTRLGRNFSFEARKLVLAGGAIGNSRLLLNSNFQRKLPYLGKGFYTHPQYMVMGLYDREINAHKGPLQSYKSYDAGFRLKGFKLENVFAPPVAISMLVPNSGVGHLAKMKQITKMACIEVAVRDTNAGRIRVNGSGRAVIYKELNGLDRERKAHGMKAIHDIFSATGAREIVPGRLGIGLHLMGGLAIGSSQKSSVVGHDFKLHQHKNIYAADSSIFPNAPGINPSLTIMALSKLAASVMLKEL